MQPKKLLHDVDCNLQQSTSTKHIGTTQYRLEALIKMQEDKLEAFLLIVADGWLLLPFQSGMNPCFSLVPNCFEDAGALMVCLFST